MTIIYFLLLAAASYAPHTQARIGEAQFVQAFYDWYVPIALADSKDPGWYRVLTERRAALNPDLVRALEADSVLQAGATEGVVGLDFDPFLNTQDPEGRYVVGRITRQGKKSLVEVYGVRAGKRRSTPAVIAELTWQRGAWVFVNFHYPDVRTDLLSVLKRLAAPAPPPSN